MLNPSKNQNQISKIVNKKIDERSLIIFNNKLKYDTPVKVTNLLNGKYILAKIGKKSKYPFFYNAVISKRIAEELEIDLSEPYIAVQTINTSGAFVAKKAKTFKEEKKVADKAPVDGITIENLGDETNKIKKTKKVYVVSGGHRRQDSVKNGLLSVSTKSQLVCIHDGARPFVSGKLIKQSIIACSKVVSVNFMV